MISQFEDFKKCLDFKKSGERWTCSFTVLKNERGCGCSFTMVDCTGMHSRSARPYMAEQLYKSVCRYTTQWGKDLNALIKEWAMQNR